MKKNTDILTWADATLLMETRLHKLCNIFNEKIYNVRYVHVMVFPHPENFCYPVPNKLSWISSYLDQLHVPHSSLLYSTKNSEHMLAKLIK